MIIFAHVLLALASLAYTTYLFALPRKASFRTHYSLVVLTVVSGIYLVLSTRTRMVEACMTGLVYLAVASTGTVLARVRLAKAVIKIKD